MPGEARVLTVKSKSKVRPGKLSAKPLPARSVYVHSGAPLLPGTSNDNTSAGLPYYWFILQRSRGIWIVFSLLGLLLGILVSIPQTPVYRASGSVEIVDFNDNFLNLKRASPVAESSSNTDWDIQTEIKILQSDSLRDRVIHKLLLSLPLKATATPAASWRKAMNLSEPAATNPREQKVRDAVNSVRVRAAGQTRILELSADSTDAELSADVVNTLADEFIEQSLEARSTMNARTGEWLARELDGVRAKLERSEDALNTYARNSGLIFTDEKTNISEDKLRQIEQELAKAQGDRIAKQSRLELIQTLPPDKLPEVLNDPGRQATNAKLEDLRQQLADLRMTFTPEHLKVKRVQVQISMLEGVLNNNRQAILDRISSEYQEAQGREKLLGAAYADQARLLTGESEKAVQYTILKREVDTYRQLYEAMLQQTKESSIASAMRASNIRVLDAAKKPLRPYKPNARHSGAFGLLCGIFLGAAFLLTRDRLDSTIQKPGDATLYLGVPELGVIPMQSANRRIAKLPPAVPLAVPIARSDGRLELATWNDKHSLMAESFRSILISILFSDDGASSPKLLVLTSSSPGEGKSTVTSNLAIALAEAGKRVLLIDADLRRPRQHDIFSRDNKHGMSTLLREDKEAIDTRFIDRLTQETQVPRLFLLTSGPATMTASNLLCSSLVPELLAYVRSEFDVVLLDTPPMLQMPDARILGRLADGVIIVIRAGQTTRHAAVAARQRFQQDGIRVLGTILNGWNPENSPIGYHAYHKGYGHTGMEEEQPQSMEES